MWCVASLDLFGQTVTVNKCPRESRESEREREREGERTERETSRLARLAATLSSFGYAKRVTSVILMQHETPPRVFDDAGVHAIIYFTLHALNAFFLILLNFYPLLQLTLFPSRTFVFSSTILFFLALSLLLLVALTPPPLKLRLIRTWVVLLSA